jgi:hypothetical protein
MTNRPSQRIPWASLAVLPVVAALIFSFALTVISGGCTTADKTAK